MALSRIWSAFIIVAILVAGFKCFFLGESQIFIKDGRLFIGSPRAKLGIVMLLQPRGGSHELPKITLELAFNGPRWGCCLNLTKTEWDKAGHTQSRDAYNALQGKVFKDRLRINLGLDKTLFVECKLVVGTSLLGASGMGTVTRRYRLRIYIEEGWRKLGMPLDNMFVQIPSTTVVLTDGDMKQRRLTVSQQVE